MGLGLIAADNLVVQSSETFEHSSACFSNALLDHFQMSSGNLSCSKSFDEVSSPLVAKWVTWHSVYSLL